MDDRGVVERADAFVDPRVLGHGQLFQGLNQVLSG